MCVAWSALSRPRIRFSWGGKPRLEIEMPKMGGRIHLLWAGPAQVVLPQADPPTRPPTHEFLFVTLPGTETPHDVAQESIVQ